MSSLQSVLRAPDYAWRTPPTYSGSSDSQSPYPSSSSSSSPSSSASSQRVKRSIPCDLCQSRKAKCDRQRPKCSMCVRRNLACNYSVRRKITISSRDMESGGITRVLDALSSDQAAELFQALCARGYDAALSRPRQISERETLRALLPATETQAEFELTTRHPIAYPVLVPLLADDLPLHSILRAKRTPLHR
ncbi:hypothetical protein GQ53DRAFT_127022 [Thozetella sp. PMI_491]|nr:hypothetical protein GQ53DRAFT_127022 [Thozetella sp. PMI_491]